MDSASKKEDNDSLLLTYLNNLSPIRQPPPVKTHHGRLSSYPLLEEPDPATFTENPYGTEKLSEEALLSHEKPKIEHQEKPAYVDKPEKIQDVEWPFQECREARSCIQFKRAESNPLGSDGIGDCELIENPFGLMRLCEDHLLSPEEYYKTVHQEKPACVDEQVKIQDAERPSQDCTTPQLMQKSSVNVTQGQTWGETWPALYVSEEKMMRDHGIENNYYNQVEETASNSVGDGGAISPHDDAHSPDDSISSPDFSSSIRDRLIAIVAALCYAAWERQMVKRSKDSKPITCSNPATVHDDNQLQPTSTGNSEEFNQLMARKNMKRTIHATYGCQCNKSECILPRCACFAAKINCTSFCYCRGCCLNRAKHEDKTDHNGRKKR